jgi:O-antigen/teichoic acid export membrane protein
MFVGNIYTLEKKSIPHLNTTIIGSVCNIALNWILIPYAGIFGAVIATLFSFTLLFIIRMVDTRRYMKLQWSPVSFFVSFILLMIQNFTMVNDGGPVYAAQIICLAGIAIVNFKPLLAGVKKVLSFR